MGRKCHSTSSRRQGPVFQRRREAEGSETSVNFQWTARPEARGMIVGCSEILPASVDVLSPSILPRSGPESDLKRSPETPPGALKLPHPRTKWVQTEAGLERKTITTRISRKCPPDGLGSDPFGRHPPDQEASRPRRNRGSTARGRTEQRPEPRWATAPCHRHGLKGKGAKRVACAVRPAFQ